jgi:hypothetical protein
VREYARWLNGTPSWFTCVGDMPIAIALGFEHLVSTLGRTPFPDMKSHTSAVERERKRVMNSMGD